MDVVRMRQMEYQGVRLNSGRAERQFEEALSYFLALPNEDILYGFYRRAGLVCRGEELGGWYSNDGSFNIYDWDEIFNTFGQWLSFFAKSYSITGRGEIYDKLQGLVRAWGKTIEEDGYFYYTWNNNAYHYSYEKVMTGLLDTYCYCHMEEAKLYLERITSWAEKNLPCFKNNAAGDRDSFTGGEKAIKGIDNEWYTLPENLYRAYLATGDEKYRSFGGKWHYDTYFRNMHQENADALKGLHGYSHVNALCSAAMAYQVTQDAFYLETIERAYDILRRYQVLASGGYAFDEHMADTQGSNYGAVERQPKAFEAPCGSYAVQKLCRYLLQFTKNAKYGDWAERVLYNALFAALPMKDDGRRRGRTFYYADYRIGGGRKVYYEHSFPCCSGTYPQAMAEYHNMIYFLDEKEIFISQYLSSSLKRRIDGEEIDIEIETAYPEEETVRIIFNKGSRRALNLRIPSWIKASVLTAALNRKEELYEVRPDTWLRIQRRWEAGDCLELSFPMRLYTLPITESHRERAALMYGPVMLSAKGRRFEIKADAAAPDKTIKKKKDSLEFYSDQENLTFLPYYEYAEKEWNTVYLDYKI